MYYIPAASVSKKLRQAGKAQEVIYIQGGIGIGKTAAVRNYVKRRRAVWFDGESGYLDKMPEEELFGDEIVIVDNISCIRDYPSMDYIRQIVRRGGRPVILIGRGMLPSWLAAVSAEVPFRFANRTDLLFGQEEIEDAFRAASKDFEQETIERIYEEGKENPLFATLLISRAIGGRLTDDDVERARITYYHVLDERFYNWLDREAQAALLSLCSFSHFSIGLARAVAANPRLESVFERILQQDACLVQENGEYVIPEPYLSYLRWKQTLELDLRARKDIFRMAACFYAMEDDPFSVLECWRQAGDFDRVDDAILRICENTSFAERNLRRVESCMNLLTAERSYTSPLIMASRSLFYSLEMNPGRSEDWYERLTEYAARRDLSRYDRVEAEFRLAYLDVFLPHRSSNGMLDRLEKYLEEKKKWNGNARHPSLTLYGYSAINGLFDLSRLIAENSESEKMQAAIRQAGLRIGGEDTSFVDLMLQELALEQGTVDTAAFESRLNRAVMDGERRGLPDRSFAAISQYVRRTAAEGNAGSAERMLNEFETRVEKDPLLPRKIREECTWLKLLTGENRAAEAWLNEAPDSRDFFSLMDRNAYILKARILLMRGEDQRALLLLTRLSSVFAECHRDYLWIKVQLLLAVLFFRTDPSRWEEHFREALLRAQDFRFVRVIADEGAAAVPLFQNLSPAFREQLDPDWLKKTENAAEEMARHYPNYLRGEEPESADLTQAERRVLHLLCEEMNSEEICELLHISYSGLKYHKRNLYRKLGVRTRNEAQRAARTLGLVH